MASVKTAIEYRAAGSNLEVANDGEFAYFRVPLDRAKAIGNSASGKTLMIAKTDGGWGAVPGTDGLRANIQVGYKV